MWDKWRLIRASEDIALGGTRRRRAGGGRALRVLSNNPQPRSVAAVAPPLAPMTALDSPATTPTSGHECGCGGADPVIRRVAKLEHKLDQLADVLQRYAQQKIEEAEEISEQVKKSAATPAAKPAASAPADAAWSAKITTNILAEQSRRDRARAAILNRDVGRIVGGTRTVPGEFPSCVLLGDEADYYCTGVLIGERLVLTAAHCGRGTSRVLAGVVDQGLASVRSAQHLDVQRAVRHSEYAESRLPWNDLMLLILSEPITPSDRVQVVPLMEQGELTELDRSVAIVGFGNDDAGATRGFGRQRKAMVEVADTFNPEISEDDLREIQESKEFSAPHEFFAGEENSGIDTCTGDSGGPVYARVGEQWKLLGITSRPAQGYDVLCGDGGLYTSVPFYLDWIQEVRRRYQV